MTERCKDCDKETDHKCSICSKPYCEECAAEFEMCTDCDPELDGPDEE